MNSRNPKGRFVHANSLLSCYLQAADDAKKEEEGISLTPSLRDGVMSNVKEERLASLLSLLIFALRGLPNL